MISFYQDSKKSVFLGLISLLLTFNSITHALPTITINGKEATESYLEALYSENAYLIVDPIRLADYFIKTIQQQGINYFWIGASSSGFQTEGENDETSSAAQHFKNMGWQTPGKAIDFWNRYTTDIPQMKEELGINCHRMSLSWNKIEPQEGVFDYKVLAHYANILKTYNAHGITPLINFHHYDEPHWLKEKDGLVVDKNIKYFVRFVAKTYEYLHEDIHFITLCNSVEGAAFKAYYTGDLYPGEKGNMQKAQECMANMNVAILEAARTIRTLHETYSQQNKKIERPFIITQINIILFDPSDKTPLHKMCHYLSQPFCALANKIQIGGTTNLLTTGNYKIYIPGMVNVNKRYENYPQLFAETFDAIGINHYSNNFMFGPKRIKETDPERCTENHNYRNYPEGLYRAIKQVHDTIALPLGKIKYGTEQALPIIITENGIATKNDEIGNKKRENYFQKALFTIAQTIKDGYNVIGYLPWASHDNYEWPSHESAGKPVFDNRCYGFFHVDTDPESSTYLKRTLKTGSKQFAAFAQKFTHSFKIA